MTSPDAAPAAINLDAESAAPTSPTGELDDSPAMLRLAGRLALPDELTPTLGRSLITVAAVKELAVR